MTTAPTCLRCGTPEHVVSLGQTVPRTVAGYALAPRDILACAACRALLSPALRPLAVRRRPAPTPAAPALRLLTPTR